MTGQEKKLLYNLLKTASSSIYGYNSPDFTNEAPNFTDDDTQVVNEDTNTTEQKLRVIAEKIAQCRRCPLCNGRTNVVPGTGVTNPIVMVIGEGPGHDEDIQGKPFVGKAGQLLDKELASIGLSREKNCFIANIVKCRPPQNRVPFEQEAEACSSFLQAQIAILKPKLILLAGSTAAKNILKTTDGVTRLRGRFYDYNGIPALVTYHPSALLRDELLKRPAWEDLKFFRSRILEIDPDYMK